jgi:DNA-binding MarR family transcriptional regulator
VIQLQKETKAPRYESIFHEAMVNVAFTQNWCNDQVKQAVSLYDITNQQFNVLRILRGQYPDPSTINLLKSRMLDKMCDASRIVDRLVQKDLICKKTNTYDKRAVDILINEKGLALLKKMDKEMDLSAILSANLTLKEAEQLTSLLEKARGRA